MPTPTVRIIRTLDFTPVFGIRGKGNTIVTFEISEADALISLAGATRARLFLNNEPIDEFDHPYDILVSPGIYKIEVESLDAWAILFGVAQEGNFPVIIILSFERN